MQLTKLEIKGFKSFGDKITINFNEGVTAIVGPNGCGKSNVVDAIRWVMGEQSTKALRSEKMENIIFNGTINRKPANLAEVSLTFENNNQVLSTEFTTVTVTRKLYRNGDSEYRLNDVKCRLKDITDLFLDTGLGSDSYSIIELKMIDEIINNKDNSRRQLFEEASGIAKYKVRKKQTLTKLRETEADLARVDDLQYEITKNLKQLESQAKKAEKYFTLKEEYKQASIGLAYYRLDGFSADLERISQQETEQKARIQEASAEIEGQETALRTLRTTIITKEQNFAAQQKITQDYIHSIRAFESEHKLKNEKLTHLQEQENRLLAELNNDKQQLTHIHHTLKRLQEELFEEQGKLELFQLDINQHKSLVDELSLQQRAAKAKLDHYSSSVATAQKTLYQQEKDIAVLHIQKEALQQESIRNITDSALKEEELQVFHAAVSDLEERLADQQHQYDRCQRDEDALQEKIKVLESHVQQTQALLQKDLRLVDAKQNEYNLTKSLVDNLEGFPESIKFLRKNAGWKKTFPLFSDILYCQEQYRVAIENFLEPIMNHYVVDQAQDAVQAVQALSNAAQGRANFFILAALPELDAPQPVDATLYTPALDVITVDAKYKQLCTNLLQHVYILNNPHTGSIQEASPLSGMVILHPDGRFTKSPLALSGGSVGLFEGKRIGRAKNLDNLTKEIKALQGKIEALEQDLLSAQQDIYQLQGQSQKVYMDELRTLLHKLQQEFISVKTKQEQYQSFISKSHERKADIEQNISTITDQLQQAEPALQILKVEHESTLRESIDFQEIYAELADTLNDKTSLYNQENIRLHQQHSKVSSILKDLEYRESQQESLEERIAKNALDYEQVKLSIHDASYTSEDQTDDIAAMYVQKENLESGLADLEKDYFAARQEIIDREDTLSAQRKVKEQTEFLIHELKDKKTTLQLELNSLKERLSVEFNLDINELLQAEFPTLDLSLEGYQAQCITLRKQLDSYGAINHMAKEAYDQMFERNAFISKEKSDLVEAKNSLMATINEIDLTANDKFMQAFNTVRENFIQVFRSLFNEEDSCDMVLSDPANPLESDIDIIARPKGKRPLSINQLSGGEKTLTATALLFSLYLLKPAPFCIFDEVDAPLDDTNIDKFNSIIRDFSENSQFIVVSHNKRTIASTDIIYGVTMVEQGVSRVVAVDIREVA